MIELRNKKADESCKQQKSSAIRGGILLLAVLVVTKGELHSLVKE